MADRIAVLIGGRLLQVATPEEVYRDPRHIDVATFIGSPRINLLSARLSTDRAALWEGHALLHGVAGIPGDPIRLGIRPEDLRLSGQSLPGAVPVGVVRVEFLGADTLVHLIGAAMPEPMVAKMPAERTAGARGGDRLFMTVDPGSVLAFGKDGARLSADGLPLPQRAHG